jgi:DNA-binding transcriptional LysR family regulator
VAGTKSDSGRSARAEPRELKHLDLHLIRVLHTLLVERNVSRTAQRLNQGQPQISSALRKLRALTEDPLLIRGHKGMVPTEHGLKLLEPARRILDEVKWMFESSDEFDVLTSHRTFSIGIPDYFSAYVVAALIAEIRTIAPQSRLAIKPVTSDAHCKDLLESGEADIVIETNVIRSGNIRVSQLFEEGIASVARTGNPHMREKLTVEEYLALPHAAAARGSGTRPGLIDRLLGQKGLKRDIQAWIPYLNALGPILARTDLVFTTTRHLATYLASATPGLRLFQPPVSFPDVRVYLLWHNRSHGAAEHQWLRAIVVRTIRNAIRP